VRNLTCEYRINVLVHVVLCVLVLAASCTSPPEEIRIGVIVTTAVPMMENSALNAVEMIREDLEKEGGFYVSEKKHPVNFVVERITGGVPEEAVKAVNKLINQLDVVAIIGPDFSIDAIPSGEVAEKAGIPLLSALSTHPKTTAGREYVFRTAFINSFQAGGMARFCVRDLEAEKLAVLYNIANPYSREIAETFQAAVKAEGKEISSFESYVTGQTDLSTQLGRIRDKAPDVLYLPNFFQETESIVVQARDMGIDAVLAGVESWHRIKFVTMPEFEGAYFTAHWDSNSLSEISKNFTDRFMSRSGQIPEDGAALTYDALGLMMKAIQHQGKFDPQSIRDGLYALGPYEGVTGTIDYIENGDPRREAVVLRFEGGEVRFVRKIEIR
jgi:branched-chain amino acid transport system substrate-binding protein